MIRRTKEPEIYREQIFRFTIYSGEYLDIRIWVPESQNNYLDTLIQDLNAINIIDIESLAVYILNTYEINAIEIIPVKTIFSNTKGIVYYANWP